MTIFVDTSALFSLLDADDDDHERARTAFEAIGANDELVTHSYVTVEALALAQRRLGARAVRALATDLLPLLTTVAVDDAAHDAALSALLAALPTQVSFVDFVSFQIMRTHGIRRAFTLDRDFEKAGFETIP